MSRYVTTPDGRVFMKVKKRHPLTAARMGQNIFSPAELAKIPGATYYAAPIEALPASEGVPTHLSQSAIEPVPRSVIAPERRTAIPARTEKTEQYQKNLTPENYLKLKTFERPGYLVIEDPIETGAVYPNSIKIPAGVGTPITGRIKVNAGYDFEVVKIMVIGRTAGAAATKEFMIDFEDTASGRKLSNNVPVHAVCFGGDGNEPLIFPVTLFINRNAQINITLTNLTAADLYVYFTLLGIRYFYPSALNLTTGIPEGSEYKRI